MNPRSRLALALDVSTAHEALTLVEATSDSVGVYKIGMQLFYAEGSDLVRQIKARGCAVFLDLKLHDIPNTVASAIGAARRARGRLLDGPCRRRACDA